MLRTHACTFFDLFLFFKPNVLSAAACARTIASCSRPALVSCNSSAHHAQVAAA